MTTKEELLVAVDVAFTATGRNLTSWPDPHPGRMPLDEEYSRVTDPAKWRIVGARAEAWAIALVNAGLATVDRGADVRWSSPPGTEISRTYRLAPRARGALPLAIAFSRIEDVDDAGVTLGAGEPATCVTWIPACGCDACDSGAAGELDELDEAILGVVSGAFRHLSADDRAITVLNDGAWSSRGLSAAQDIETVLADPSGWQEVSGTSWFAH